VAAIAAASLGEITGQRLGDGAVGAGRMPTSSLATRERVDALIDHRVVPVSLACHVALHDLLLQTPAICRPMEDIGRNKPSPHVELGHRRIENPKVIWRKRYPLERRRR
jgi:hypothetical protein